MSDTPINADPFNCPDCGSHDYGLYAPVFGACPHCMKRENADLRAKLEEARKDAQAMKAATYSHVDGRDLLHELQPNGAHHIDILVRINGQDRRYQGDWLKTLTWARDGHNMGEYADNPRLRAMIESRRAASPDAQEGMTGSGIDAAIRRRGKP